MLEVLPEVLTKMKKIPKERLLSRLSEKGVSIFTETQLTSIEKTSVRLRKVDGEEFVLQADQVILAIQAEPENRLIEGLKGKVKEVIAVGDAASPGDLGHALRSATEVALKL